jgi:hypothetical protein
VAAIAGVTNDVPVPKTLPPEATSYQLMVPDDAVAPKVRLPVSQRLAGVVPVIAGVVFTVATTATLAETQLPLEDST